MMHYKELLKLAASLDDLSARPLFQSLLGFGPQPIPIESGEFDVGKLMEKNQGFEKEAKDILSVGESLMQKANELKKRIQEIKSDINYRLPHIKRLLKNPNLHERTESLNSIYELLASPSLDKFDNILSLVEEHQKPIIATLGTLVALGLLGRAFRPKKTSALAKLNNLVKKNPVLSKVF